MGQWQNSLWAVIDRQGQFGVFHASTDTTTRASNLHLQAIGLAAVQTLYLPSHYKINRQLISELSTLIDKKREQPSTKIDRSNSL